MSEYHNNSIFWVETSKINPNPFQPRREFNQAALEDLADSIRQYGVLQPLVVTRREEHNENGGLSVYYELIAGERRLRASKLAHLEQVPVIIRKDTDNKIKLELAIIENLQREDLNPIDRALAFEQLYKQFDLTHSQIGKKMGKSRVYVSNSLRLLSLPEEIKQGLMDGKITEGHTRPLLMLSDKPEEQSTLFREINLKKLSVRDSEKIARSIAQDRVRKKKFVRDPRIRDYEKKLSDNLGTRVQIEQKEKGGKIMIDYFSVKDLESILASIKKIERESGGTMMDVYEKQQEEIDSQNAISNSGPINFMTGEINNFYKNEAEDIDEVISKNDVEEKNFLKTEEGIENKYFEKFETEIHQKADEVVNTIPSEIPVYTKRLAEYEHKTSEEIVRYREELPAYEHQLDEEISLADQFKTVNEKVDESVFDVSNNINNQGQTATENIQQNPVYLQNQESEKIQKQNYEDYQNQQVAQQLLNSQTYQNGQAQQNYQYKQPKKKGFFGKLFG